MVIPEGQIATDIPKMDKASYISKNRLFIDNSKEATDAAKANGIESITVESPKAEVIPEGQKKVETEKPVDETGKEPVTEKYTTKKGVTIERDGMTLKMTDKDGNIIPQSTIETIKVPGKKSKTKTR